MAVELPDQEALFEKVSSAIAEVLAINKARIRPESRYLEDLGATSLDMATMLMLLEDELDIQIPELEARQMKTVQEAIDLVCHKCGKTQGAL